VTSRLRVTRDCRNCIAPRWVRRNGTFVAPAKRDAEGYAAERRAA
jgi:hypothetical protein